MMTDIMGIDLVKLSDLGLSTYRVKTHTPGGNRKFISVQNNSKRPRFDSEFVHHTTRAKSTKFYFHCT